MLLVAALCGVLTSGCPFETDISSSDEATDSPAFDGTYDEVHIYLHGPLNLTGNEVLSRALPGFGEATVTRTRQMAMGLHDLMVNWPNDEWNNHRSKLRLEDSNQVAAAAWPIDHPLLPWRDPVSAPPSIVPKLTDQRESTSVEDGAIRLEIIFELADADNFRVVVRELAAGGGDINVCEKQLKAREVLQDERGVVLDQVVDFVAACSLASHLQKHRDRFAQSYALLLSANDPEHLSELIRGIEQYSNFIRAPDKSTESSALALELAIGHFTNIAQSRGRGGSFAKYLLVHSSTTVHGYKLAREVQHQHGYISDTIDAVFGVEPFNRTPALWTKALAYEKHSRITEAQKVWDTLEKQVEIPQASDARVKALVRKANLHRNQAEFGDAALLRNTLKGLVSEKESTFLARAGVALEEGVDYVFLHYLTRGLAAQARLHRGIAAYLNKTNRRLFQTLGQVLKSLDADVALVASATSTLSESLDPQQVFSCDDEESCVRLRALTAKRLDEATTFFSSLARDRLKTAYQELRSEMRVACIVASVTSRFVVTLEPCVAATAKSILDPDSTSVPMKLLLESSYRVRGVQAKTESPLSEAEIDQLDELGANIAGALAKISCESGDVDLGLSIAQEYSSRSKYRAELASVLVGCRLAKLTPGGPSQRPAFVGWVFSPPSPEDARNAEEDLKLFATDGDPSALAALALVEYAELWPGLQRYFLWSQEREKVRHDVASEMRKLEGRARKRRCDDVCVEALLEEAWGIAFSSEMEALLADVDGLWRDFLRRNTQLAEGGSTGNEGSDRADNEYKRYVSLIEQYTKARDGYGQWRTRNESRTTTARERARLIVEARERVQHVRALVDSEMSMRMAEILSGFFSRYGKTSVEASDDDLSRVSKLAFLRVFDRTEKLDRVTREAVISSKYEGKSLQRLVDEAISVIISEAANSQYLAGMAVPLDEGLMVLAHNGRGMRHRQGAAKHRALVRSRSQAVSIVESSTVSGTCQSSLGSVSHGASVCVERFLIHMLINPDIYNYDEDASDLMREESSDFLAAFDEWNRNAAQPENAAIALWWLMQDDRTAGVETKPLTSSG